MVYKMFSNRVEVTILAVAGIAIFLCVYMYFGVGLRGSVSSIAGTCSVSKANLSWNTEYAPSDKFCIVLHTFVRTDLMLPLLQHYSKLPKVTRIIVVWSDKRLTPPLKEWEELGPHPVPVHFRVQERDSIMNKLQPFPEIDTPGVLLVDDDMIISEGDIDFAFNTWKQVPHLIVGWYPRQHGQDKAGHYKYEVSFDKYSMLLTSGAFVHKEYLRMFTSVEVPDSMRQLVDSLINCEDILFNVMVAFYLKKLGMPQCPGLHVLPRELKDIQEASKTQRSGLSLRDDHYKERHLCLDKFAEVYGEMPLMYSSITAVQYSQGLQLPVGINTVEHI